MAVIPVADPDRPLPPGCGREGRGARFWAAVTALHEPTGTAKKGKPVYVLRPDELLVLEEACRALDRVDAIEKCLGEWVAQNEGSYYTPGLQGTVSANPLLPELRQQIKLTLELMTKLKLPDAKPARAARGEKTLRQHQAEAVGGRWHKAEQTG